MARPTKFNDSISELIVSLYEEGKTDAQVAEIVGVCEKTLNNWKGKHPEFLQALKRSKQAADELVEASLFRRAVGYSHKAVKILAHEGQSWEHEYLEHYPPDTTAAIFWLKNRQPDKWREKMPGEENQININLTLADKMAKARARAQKK